MFDLSRFTTAHQGDGQFSPNFETAYREITNGRKDSHWMWYIFPQIKGLGHSPTAEYYAIRSLDEAKAFLADPYLGGNLVAICQALLQLRSNNADEVFGYPDYMKLRSSMTLFSCAAGGDSVFDKVLDKFFDGIPDRRTLDILSRDE